MTNDSPCSAPECSTAAQCCPKKWLMAAIVAFIITFFYDGLVHGVLLMGQYVATASLWRPEAEMNALFSYCIGKHALEALVFAALFLGWKRYQSFGALFSSLCPVRKGFCFGATVGLLVGLNAAASYIYMPITQTLALSWLAAETIKWALTGAVLALLCTRCSKKA